MPDKRKKLDKKLDPLAVLTKKPVGRPTIVTAEVREKLRLAFMIGCNDAEACSYANISVETLYAYQRKWPQFLKLKEEWKQTDFLRARQRISKGIDESFDNAFRFMERKKPDEFGPKGKLDITLKGQQMIEDLKKEMGIDEETLDKEALEEGSAKDLPVVQQVADENVPDGALPVPDPDQPSDSQSLPVRPEEGQESGSSGWS